jgi:hypothetical protein
MTSPALADPVSPAAAIADLDAWLDWTRSTHPDLSYTTDMAALDAAAQKARMQLAQAASLRDAWAAMAGINPILDDAHTGLRLPEEHFDTWIAAGGTPFPAPVEIREGRVFLAGEGAEIVAINGVEMTDAIAWLMPRLRGEDVLIRQLIASLRFPLALWTYAGGAERYEVQLKMPDGKLKTRFLDREVELTEDGREELVGEAEADRHFRVSFEGDYAILEADTFDKAHQDSFGEFLPGAFAQIAAANTQHLIIDLRKNGGGAHDVSDLLMAYLTDQPHSPISAVTARIVPENQQLIPNANLGDVVRVPFTQTVTPPQELANRFTGDVWILIGPKTYSQAIVFAATAKDHGLAQLAGEPTSGRANQTAQVQRKRLDETGFVVQSPIYVFVRPSGDRSAERLRPDLILSHEAEVSYPAVIAQLSQYKR